MYKRQVTGYFGSSSYTEYFALTASRSAKEAIMRVKKTKQSDRGVYRYPVQVEDGRGGYRTAYNVIKPGEDGITEVMIKSLHAMLSLIHI